MQSRGLIPIHTASPPDNPHPIHFDPTSLLPDPPLYTPPNQTSPQWSPPPSQTPLIIPTFLLYPAYNQSDLISHFDEETSFDDQLADIFPASPKDTKIRWASWDIKREYFTSNLAVYVETSQKRLLKIGKELTLREVIGKARREAKDDQPKDGIVLQDGLLSFVVLARGAGETEWIDEFKRKRDEGKR